MRFSAPICLTASLLLACTPKTAQQDTAVQKTETPSVTSQTKTAQIPLLTPAIIHSDPSLSGPRLNQARISPDGRMVTVLQGRDTDAFQQDLWAYDLGTGKGRRLVSSTDLLGAPEELSDEEKNRRERARIKGKGIVAYSWDSKGEQILFPLGGDVFVYRVGDGKAVRVTNTSGYETDARISPSGRYVSYVREDELYVTDLTNGRETRLSFGAGGTIRNATASFVVQEELARSTGYWMSPDERLMAYEQIDESPVKIEHRIEFGADGIRNVAQRYPFAGTDNVRVKLGVVPVSGGETVWVDIGNNPDIYLARVYWSKDSGTLYVGILSRDEKTLRLLAVDPKTGASHELFRETSPTWINVRGDFVPLSDGGFLWSSERSGFWHIYRYDKDGKNPRAITSGNWPVTKVNCVNEEEGRIYFTGWQQSALERQIYSIGLDGTNLRQISRGKGWHSASFSKNCRSYIETFSDKNTPPQTRVFDNTGKPQMWLNENRVDEHHPYFPYLKAHITPEFGQIAAEDGQMMDYNLYKPLNMQKGKTYPAITFVYGGPGVQRVGNYWGEDKQLLAEVFAQHGFVVFQLDSRGATGRGKKFEDVLYRSMGHTEVQDQAKGAAFLKALPYVDGDRMGLYGWSYGGYMTLHMLAQTDLYKAGVSGAPVTDWTLYDTAYTERYLGDPRPDNPNYTKGAYENASVFAHIDGLTEPFLLLHGMADDNVVFRHSIKLMAEMQKRGRHNLRLMTYPGEKHGFRKKENKIHRDEEIFNFLTNHLAGTGQ